jgi:hypothetical protein
MRKEMMSIGLTCIALAIIFTVYIFFLAFRADGVNGFFFLIPFLLIITSIILITEGMKTRESPLGFSVPPYPPYYTPPNLQYSVKVCINCNRGIPLDSIICPYCGIKWQGKEI